MSRLLNISLNPTLEDKIAKTGVFVSTYEGVKDMARPRWMAKPRRKG